MNLDSKWVVERFDTAWLEWTRCTRKSSLDAVNGRGRHGRVSRRRVRVDSPLRPACRPSPHCKMSTNQNQSIALLLVEFELFTHKYGSKRTKTFQSSLFIIRSIDCDSLYLLYTTPCGLPTLFCRWLGLLCIHPLLSSKGVAIDIFCSDWTTLVIRWRHLNRTYSAWGCWWWQCANRPENEFITPK